MRQSLFKTPVVICALAALHLSACGGSGSSSGDGLIIQGVLVQGATEGHSSRLESLVLHSENQAIENVDICALGECSRTDGNGVWGFSAPESFDGGEVLFTVNGHGIADELAVEIPSGAKEIMLELINGEGNKVAVHEISADGTVVSHNHDAHG